MTTFDWILVGIPGTFCIILLCYVSALFIHTHLTYKGKIGLEAKLYNHLLKNLDRFEISKVYDYHYSNGDIINVSEYVWGNWMIYCHHGQGRASIFARHSQRCIVSGIIPQSKQMYNKLVYGKK